MKREEKKSIRTCCTAGSSVTPDGCSLFYISYIQSLQGVFFTVVDFNHLIFDLFLCTDEYLSIY